RMKSMVHASEKVQASGDCADRQATAVARWRILSSSSCQSETIWLALKIDEYVPETMPITSASAKLRIEKPPNSRSASSVSTTVSDVITDRASVCMME